MLLTNFILTGNFLPAISCTGKSEILQTWQSYFSLFKVVILQGRKDFVLLLLFEPEEWREWSVKYKCVSLVRIPWNYFSEQQGREKLVKIKWRCFALTCSAHLLPVFVAFTIQRLLLNIKKEIKREMLLSIGAQSVSRNIVFTKHMHSTQIS